MTTRDRRFLFGDCELDLGTFRLLRAGAPVPVEPKALDLLQLLVERAPKVVDKAEIFSIVWKDVAVTDNVLTRLIAQLRRALDDDAKAPRYIETAATRGYRFIADVTVVADDRLAEEAPYEASRRDAAPPAASQRPWTRIAAVAAAIVAAALLAWRFLPPSRTPARVSSAVHDPVALAALRPQLMTASTGFDGFLAYSPDGGAFAYSSDRSGKMEIYVQGSAPGSVATQLTTNGKQNVGPAWSPDGRLIVYHEMSGNGLWVVPSRAGVSRKLSDFGSHAAWSPDGRRLVFQSAPLTELNSPGGSQSTLWIVDADGHAPPGRLTMPGDPPGPHLTPQWRDSERIIFATPASSVPGQISSLWAVGPSGGAPRRILSHRELTGEFAIAPDGSGIYFGSAGNHSIWWLPLTDGLEPAGPPAASGLAATGVQHLSISTDGRRIAWTTTEYTSHIWAADLDKPQRGPTALTQGAGVRYGLPSPSSDGRLALVSIRPGTPQSIFALLPDGTLRQLITDPVNHGNPHWMPGEKEIAITASHSEGPGFWALDPETRRERKLFLMSALPRPAGAGPGPINPLPLGFSFSKDFTRLAMTLTQGGTPNVWVATLRKLTPMGPLVQRTFEKDGGSYSAWSPDGRWMAYQCNKGTDTHLCVVGAEAGEREQIVDEPGQSWLGGWGPDNDTIYFAARRDAVWNVASVSRQTRAVTMLTHFTEPRIYVRYPRWDGTNHRIVFERAETSGRIWSVELPVTSS